MTHRFRRSRPSLFALEGREVPSIVGTLDPSFGTGGKVFQGSIPFQAVAVEPDGKIVAVSNQGGDFAIVRYNTDGSLDTGFGTNGITKVDFASGSDDQAFDVAVQSDGKIVVVGSTLTTTNGDDFAIARLNTDGSLDTGFGTGGKVNIDFGGGGTKDDVAHAVAIASNGDIFVVGTATDAGGKNSVGVARLNPNGTPATGFGNNGHQFLGVFGGTNDEGNGIAIAPDGKVVVAGTTNTNGNDFAVARLDPTTGQLDTTFNTTGAKTINFKGTSDDEAFDVAVQSDGKIVVVGKTDVNAGEFDAAVARLNTNGSLDTSFDTDGLETVDFGTPGDSANRVLIQPDGKIVLVGNTDGDMAVARLLPANGALDTTFNGTGKNTSIVGSSFQGNGGALQPNGRIVVAGRSNSSSDGAVARLFGTAVAANEMIATGTPDGKGVLYTVASGATTFTSPGTSIDLLPGTTAKNVRATLADVNGDGVLDRIIVSGPGAPVTLSVRSGVDNSVLVAPFAVFESSFTGGGFVAAADLNGDGKAEIIVTPDQGGGPVVAVYSGSKLATGSTGDAAQIVRFFGIADPNFRGGARPAIGDINGDGTPDLIVSAGFLGGPRIAVFNGKDIVAANPNPGRLVNDFFAFENTVRNGVFVAAGDINGDGFADLVFGGGPTAGPRVRVVSGKALLGVTNLTDLDTAVPANPGLQIGNFFAGDPNTRGGVPVAVKDMDGDNKADIAAASGENVSGFPSLPSRVLVYKGTTVLAGGTSTPAADQTLDPFSSTLLAGGVFVG
jgi:uncharacterized delta-60 repeat protein